MSKGPMVADHRHAVALAAVLTAASIFCWYDAYERRGRKRPWWLSLFPGAT